VLGVKKKKWKCRKHVGINFKSKAHQEMVLGVIKLVIGSAKNTLKPVSMDYHIME
jgi:hypothetical protein